MWNEKGFTVLKNMIDDHVDCTNVDNIINSFEQKKVGKKVVCGTLINGDYSTEDTAILLLLRMSSSIKAFFNESAFASVCYNREGKGNNKKFKTAAALSKN